MTVEDWSQLALIGAGVFGFGAIGASMFARHPVARTVYWVLSYLAVSCLALFATPQGWGATAQATVAGIALAVGYAFFKTPFLKKGGRDVASETGNSTEAQSYDGNTSATATWWLMAVCACLLAAGLIATRWSAELLVVVALGAALAAMFGYDDGSRGFPHARGQHLPFRIAAAASLVAGGIPLWCYLYAYRRGGRHPGYGKHDIVRRRRARLRDKDH